MASFEKAYPFVLSNELGYVVDQGGPTQDGVTQKDYDAYRSGKNLVHCNVRQMSSSEREEIYRRWWNPLFDQIDDQRLATKLFDVAFNTSSRQGKSTVIELLQRALCLVEDGVFGPQTLRATNAREPQVLYDELVARVCQHYVRILLAHPEYVNDALGWLRRATRTPI